MTRRAFLALLTCLPACRPVVAAKPRAAGFGEAVAAFVVQHLKSMEVDNPNRFLLFTSDGCREFTYEKWIEFTRPTVTFTAG